MWSALWISRIIHITKVCQQIPEQPLGFLLKLRYCLGLVVVVRQQVEAALWMLASRLDSAHIGKVRKRMKKWEPVVQCRSNNGQVKNRAANTNSGQCLDTETLRGVSPTERLQTTNDWVVWMAVIANACGKHGSWKKHYLSNVLSCLLECPAMLHLCSEWDTDWFYVLMCHILTLLSIQSLDLLIKSAMKSVHDLGMLSLFIVH